MPGPTDLHSSANGPGHDAQGARFTSGQLDPSRLRLDEYGRVLDAGRAAARALGRDVDELVGLSLDDIVLDHDLPALRRHLGTPALGPCEVRLYVQGSGIRWRVASCRGIAVAGAWEMEIIPVGATSRTRPLRADNQAALMTMLARSSEPVMIIAPDTTICWASASITEVLGWRPDELIGLPGLEFVHPEDQEHLARELLDLMTDGRSSLRTVGRLIDASGGLVHIEMSSTDPTPGWIDDHGIARTVFGLWMHDVSSQTLAEEALQDSASRLQLMMSANTDVTMLADRGDGDDVDGGGEQLRIRWVSPSVEHLLGYPSSTVAGSDLERLVHPADVATVHGMAVAVGDGTVAPATVRLVTAVGGQVWVELVMAPANDPSAAGAVVISARDVTVRRELENRLAQAATRDHLTRLWNRAYVLASLDDALDDLVRSGHGDSLALVFLDLDHFKNINDTRGHHTGDQLLTQIAGRLKDVCGDDDVVGRLGGDEFVVMRRRIAGDDALAVFADRLREVFRFPFRIGELEIVASASIGIVTSDGTDGDGGTVDALTLLRDVDIAMYQAKDDGRDRAVRFDAELRRSVLERAELEAFLRHAVQREELIVHYQPVLDLASGRWVGMEALVRWMHPTRGLLGPRDFIPLAEDTGVIAALGDWVLEEAVRTLAQFRAAFAGAGQLWLSVNAAPQQVDRPDFAPFVHTLLGRYGLPAECLVLELTERSLVAERPSTFASINALVDLGVRLAIDDFGTGYSSLSYLHRLPVAMVKLDGSFIRSIATNQRERVIVSSIVKLCSALGIATIAEGIEDRDQIGVLHSLGCAAGQGFLFDRPLPLAEVLTRFLDAAGLSYEQRALGAAPRDSADGRESPGRGER